MSVCRVNAAACGSISAFAILRKVQALSCAGLLIALTAISAAAQDRKPDVKKEWKERAEYELYDSVTKSQDPHQWLTALDKWKTQYPQSDFADLRRQLYLASYRALNQPRQAFDSAAEVLKDNPNNLVALSALVEYLYPLVPLTQADLTPGQSADLDTAEMGALALRDKLDVVCSKENRPPDMSDDQVAKAKPALKLLAQRALGYISLERREYPKAQAELTAVLAADANQGQVSFWLGRAILAQNKTRPDLQPVALYHFARASTYDGPAALMPADRQTLTAYLKDAYVKYHGSADGLDKLIASAKSSAMPAAAFAIKSKADLDKEAADREAELERQNPSLGLWKRVRLELQGAGGASYFDASMKGAVLPGNVNGVAKFKGKLVSMVPETKPKELVLAIENSDKPDVTLRLDSALPGKMAAGSEIEFEGIADSFQKDPFMVIFNVEKAKIGGWAGKPAPASKKGTTGKKPAAKSAGL